ncbi:tRNA (N6-threonylcarbamoyladenosine(37)-N6)-methyltransferase TrmO [Sporomusa acidovorans]|uniref:TsaA-like domain-containing protein n=1 Tax=Sporomusa acidovorans (strain ATCC 49682 / DSM 3132 / Mol) TaxID=1123286 RepID=A0ABZ3J5E1_SPOA4|nr:tRNA (N6-threonylcarbamoyladenosine(37)-N6)-methyltransferase TrmO [Sporomusa acidovorans]OZC15401.1 S-adenosyl-L-methionine-binding protein [Sporomusa acidovorans DSM 3132]SDF13330.1 tRNA-Thr(GGU) m(6)t(6)A37 methyltransferase TsaA [Sporomusa acidovorans]
MADLTITDGSVIRPIGYVESILHDTMAVPLGGAEAIIRIEPEYQPALYRIDEHSHLWILSWFGQADRSVLRVVPSKVNPDLPERGVFGLRSAARPNPIALTLVKLERIEGERLYVRDLDAVDGTLVLDIKPYFEADIVFSPHTPYMPPREYQTRKAMLYKQAVAHHGERCAGLELAVKMALLVEEQFGQLQSPDLKLMVEGDACLADVLQGVTRARLTKPQRFFYQHNPLRTTVRWIKAGEGLTVTVQPDIDLNAAIELSAEKLFILQKFSLNT